MADINVERKDRSIWPWILGLLLLGLLIWGLIELLGDDDDEVAELPVAEAPVVDEVQPVPPAATPLPTPVAQGAGIPISQIIESPATFTGQTLAGEVQVGDVVSDRGFWITDQGERLFVIINENVNTPGETINIEPGQTLRIREATVYGADQMANIPGTIEPQARQIAEGQPVVLTTDGANIEILSPAGAM